MKKFIKSYSLSLALFLLFLLSWLLQFIFQYREEYQQALDHGQELTMDKYIDSFASATLENWQSEFLQLFTMVILTTYLIHKGSPQSKDGSQRMERKINELNNKVDKLINPKRK